MSRSMGTISRDRREPSGHDEVMAHHECDWRKVAADQPRRCRRGKQIYYQKHMTHHLLPNIGRDG